MCGVAAIIIIVVVDRRPESYACKGHHPAQARKGEHVLRFHDHDWSRLMDHLGVSYQDPRRAKIETKEHACDIPTRGAVVAKQRLAPATVEEKVSVASLYHDDFECLGYHKPKV